MKCEKCGADIPNRYMYCEKCGEEIHIVPVFEPEVETQIDETMQRIQGDVVEQFEITVVRKRKHHYLAWIIILVVFSVFAGIYALTYLYKSPIYQVNWGNRYAQNGEYTQAIQCYERAINNGAKHPVEEYLYMAKCYEELGYEGKYEEALLHVIGNQTATEDELMIAYTKLINFYSNGKNYHKINSLLKSCNNDKIISIYKNFMVSVPKFSHSPGYYREVIPLKITSEQGYVVYYTLDGTTPTTDSMVFGTPIFLENVEYEIQAICVDKNGILSDVLVGEFQIES